VARFGVHALHPVFIAVDNTVHSAVDGEVPAVGAAISASEMRGDDLGIRGRDEAQIGEPS
jgi:hypothetical protein